VSQVDAEAVGIEDLMLNELSNTSSSAIAMQICLQVHGKHIVIYAQSGIFKMENLSCFFHHCSVYIFPVNIFIDLIIKKIFCMTYFIMLKSLLTGSNILFPIKLTLSK